MDISSKLLNASLWCTSINHRFDLTLNFEERGQPAMEWQVWQATCSGRFGGKIFWTFEKVGKCWDQCWCKIVVIKINEFSQCKTDLLQGFPLYIWLYCTLWLWFQSLRFKRISWSFRDKSVIVICLKLNSYHWKKTQLKLSKTRYFLIQLPSFHRLLRSHLKLHSVRVWWHQKIYYTFIAKFSKWGNFWREKWGIYPEIKVLWIYKPSNWG